MNSHVDPAEVLAVPLLQVPAGSRERHLARLERTRRERDPAVLATALAGLRAAAAAPESSATNLMPHFLACAAAYATLGEQCRVLREVFGEYREPAAI
jgi:methylmalonyl-CoA mutase N-terminal domain/subunit